MCSVEDDGEIQPTKTRSNQSVPGKTCVKCDQPGVIVTRIHDSFCKACFQVYVIHKFRAAIGKSKLIREGEQVLLAFSGGMNSAALLHLIQDGLSDRAHRKLRFIPTILHIDESGVVDMSSEARHELRQLMLKSGFPAYIANLEQALNMDSSKNCAVQAGAGCLPGNNGCLAGRVEDVSSGFESDPHHREKLRSLIESLPSATSQEDFIRNLRNQLIVCIARQLGFTKVLTADCSTRLAIQILTDVAQGRGSQISLNTAFCDQRNQDVLFVRPVRDINAKELAMYNALFGVGSVFVPTLTTKTATDTSIQRLTETFVTGLQADFSSTVANIVRTSEKLEPPDIAGSQACAFCQSPLDTNVGKASALCAVEFSQSVSRSGQKVTPAGCHGDETVCQNCEPGQGPICSCDRPSGQVPDSVLCYGCRVTLQNFNYTKSSLPKFFTHKSETTKQSDLLREKIADFLLDDVEDNGDS